MTETVIMSAEPLVSRMKEATFEGVTRFKREKGAPPKLVALLIGHDPVSRIYVELKTKDAEEVGIISEVLDLSKFSKDESQGKILDQIKNLNEDKTVSAIIPQMPFDGMANEEEVFATLSPLKDVDGLTPFRLGKLMRREYSLEESLLPCTPKGVVLLLKYYGIELKGANVAIVGRSTLVGEPLRKLLQDNDATATCYHTSSKDLGSELLKADIVVSASGRPIELYHDSGFRLTGQMVKEGCVVVGVGVKKDVQSGKMLFDVDTKSMKGKASFLTPNTGGVGAMTRAVLMQNTLIAARINS